MRRRVEDTCRRHAGTRRARRAETWRWPRRPRRSEARSAGRTRPPPRRRARRMRTTPRAWRAWLGAPSPEALTKPCDRTRDRRRRVKQVGDSGDGASPRGDRARDGGRGGRRGGEGCGAAPGREGGARAAAARRAKARIRGEASPEKPEALTAPCSGVRGVGVSLERADSDVATYTTRVQGLELARRRRAVSTDVKDSDDGGVASADASGENRDADGRVIADAARTLWGGLWGDVKSASRGRGETINPYGADEKLGGPPGEVIANAPLAMERAGLYEKRSRRSAARGNEGARLASKGAAATRVSARDARARTKRKSRRRAPPKRAASPAGRTTRRASSSTRASTGRSCQARRRTSRTSRTRPRSGMRRGPRPRRATGPESRRAWCAGETRTRRNEY